MAETISFTLNDESVSINTDGQRPLLWVLRTDFGLTGTKFGHYEFVHDQLCISSTLDRPDVPAFVIDHVMHHELLHKKHGFRWQGTRQHTHTHAFRADERTFPHYEEAACFLDQISASAS